MSSRMVYRAIWIPAALLCVGQALYYSQKPPAVSAPAPLKSYTTKDGTISLLRPSNWKPKTVSSHAIMTEVRFDPSPTARFVISHDLTGSLIADMARSGSTMFDNLPGMPSSGDANRKTPLQLMHLLQKKELEAEFEDIKEGEETKVQVAGFEALRSDFTCENGNVVGKRFTALTGEGHLSVLTVCTKKEANYMGPTFEQMFESLQVGRKGGM